jgi:hypothetical protein
MATKAINLFDAYAQSALPDAGGYIVSTFFDASSPYARYEVVAYGGVRNLVLSTEGLTFQADGNKVFVLCEPPGYIQKYVEPCSRDSKHEIPHRFNELDIITTKNQTKVMVSKKALLTYGSFTILRPTGNDFSVLFYNLPDVVQSIEQFFGVTLNKEAGIPLGDAKRAAKLVVKVVKQFTVFG